LVFGRSAKGEQGYPPAQANIGVMYAKGQGVPQSYVEAAKWYRLDEIKLKAPASFGAFSNGSVRNVRFGSRPIHSAPVPTDVRYASNSGRPPPFGIAIAAGFVQSSCFDVSDIFCSFAV
jgi:hypothetical protein